MLVPSERKLPIGVVLLEACRHRSCIVGFGARSAAPIVARNANIVRRSMAAGREAAQTLRSGVSSGLGVGGPVFRVSFGLPSLAVGPPRDQKDRNP